MYKLVKYENGGFTKKILAEFETEDAASEAFELAVSESEFYDVFNIETDN